MSTFKRKFIAIILSLSAFVGIFFLATGLVTLQKANGCFQDLEVFYAGGIILLSLLSMGSLLHLITYIPNSKNGSSVFIVAYQNLINKMVLVAEVSGLTLGLFFALGWLWFRGYFDIGIVIGTVEITIFIISILTVTAIDGFKESKIFKNLDNDLRTSKKSLMQ